MKALIRCTLSFGLLLAWSLQPLFAADAAPDPASAAAPLPAEAKVHQSVVVGGKHLQYVASAGAIPVFNAAGKRIGEVGYTAYVLDGQTAEQRPVTFAFNGGPGSSSGFLNVGAIGPKRVQMGAQGNSPSDTPRLVDNEGSWLEFSDLVFIDPVGTGFSRALTTPEEAQKAFYGIEQDVQYLSGVVFDWLKNNARMASPKFMVGESYGGFRTPRIVRELQTWRGVGVSGLILISPYLDSQLVTPTAAAPTGISPMAWIVTLPTMAASRYEAQGRALTPQLMAEVEDYARGEYAADLLKGLDPAAQDRMARRISAFTALSEAEVRRMGGRIEVRSYVRLVNQGQGRVGSNYDVNVTLEDAYPWSPENRSTDPVVQTFTTTAATMTDFLTRVVGWKAQGRYWAFNPGLFPQWDGWTTDTNSVGALREILALDPKIKVLIAHGYSDLSCPYFASRLIADQIQQSRSPGRLKLSVYPGGHMFYSRPDSVRLLQQDARTLYQVAP